MGQIHSNTITVGDFNTLLSIINRTFKHKINNETKDLKNTIAQMGLTDTYRTSYPKAAEYPFFSSVHRTASRIGHK